MKKIGTVSLNINAPDFNYGAMLHSWAFQQYLLRMDDVDTEIIDYTTPKVEGWNRYNPQKSKMNYGGPKHIEGTMENYLKRAEKFDNFIRNNLKVSKDKYVQKTIANANLPYDVVVCESDVIWAPRRGKLDPVFFLATPSMQNKRRIAYSPSMADADLSAEHEEQLDFLLKNLHFISFRESKMEKVLRRHTDKPVKHVVDPVMLLDPEDYDPITAPRLVDEKYMFLYLPVDENEVLRQHAENYAKEHGLKILEISTKLKDNEAENEICIPDAGVEEFLSAIKYSEIVFTNSFHAICFAVIYGRQFYAFTRKFNVKVLDACRFFGLEDYYVFKDRFVEKEPFDTEKVRKRYKELQKEGREWFENALTAELPPDDGSYDPAQIEALFDNTSTIYRMGKKILKKAKKGKKLIKKAKKKVTAYARKRYTENVRNKFEIEKNKIVVMTITNSYNCNPKYICEEIIRRKLPYDITWLVSKNTDLTVFPKEIKTLDKDSREAIKEVYSAKLWLDNGICFSRRYEKKPEQKHIQTMHGSLGIKRLDNSIQAREKTENGLNIIRRESENTDFVLTNSQFEENVFRTVFWKNTCMKRLGHARTDILFSRDTDKSNAIREDLLRRYGIPKDKKLVLYAPTHRKGLKMKDLALDYPDLTKTLSEKFGGEYVVMLRIHDKTKKILDKGLIWTDELRQVLYNVTDYPDIQELMMVTDIGITDYSSWIYDYVNMKRPGFIFSTDLDRFNNLTGLYYPLEETPFPVCRSHEEVVRQIRAFDMEDYSAKVDKFLEDKQSMDDGNGAGRAVDLIEELMK